MSPLIHILMLGSAVAVHLWLRRNEDLRRRLGWKVHLSHGLLVCAALGLGANLAGASGTEVVGVFGGAVCLIGLGWCWIPEISAGAAYVVEQTVYGDGAAGDNGFRPDYGPARTAIAEGEFRDAVKLIHTELAKEPRNFEGLWLLTKAEEGLAHYAEALAQLDLLLANPDTTDEQREYVQAEKAHCLCLQAQAPKTSMAGRFH